MKRLVGWELSRSHVSERVCHSHFTKLVNWHAPWQPHLDDTGAPCPTCGGNQLVRKVLDMFAGMYPWVPASLREQPDNGDRDEEEEEKKHEPAAGDDKKEDKRRGKKPASAPYVDDRSPKKRRQAEAFARAVAFRVVMNQMWQADGRVHTKRQKDGTLVEIRPPRLCLVPHVSKSARMITLDARDIAALTGAGIPRPKAAAKGVGGTVPVASSEAVGEAAPVATSEAVGEAAPVASSGAVGEAAPVAASEKTPKVGAKGTNRGRDESVISPESAAKQAKVKPPKLRLWDFMLPETWKRVQFYRSMGRKLEAPGSPWGYPNSIRTNGYVVQVLFPKRELDASADGQTAGCNPIPMDAIEDVTALQGRQIVGLDPGEIHIVANDAGGVITKERYYGAKSMPRASRRARDKRSVEKPRPNRRVRPPVEAEAIRQAAPPQSGGMQAVLAFAATHADIAKVYRGSSKNRAPPFCFCHGCKNPPPRKTKGVTATASFEPSV